MQHFDSLATLAAAVRDGAIGVDDIVYVSREMVADETDAWTEIAGALFAAGARVRVLSALLGATVVSAQEQRRGVTPPPA